MRWGVGDLVCTERDGEWRLVWWLGEMVMGLVSNVTDFAYLGSFD